MGNQHPDLRALGFLEPQPRPPRKTPFTTKIHLTKTALLALPAMVMSHALKEVEFCCTQHRGLHAIVSGFTGRVVLYSRYSYGGKPHRIRIGPFGIVTIEDARIQNHAIQLAVCQGRNPKASRPVTITLSELFTDHYIVRHQGRKKSLHTDVSRFNTWVRPSLGKLSLDEITPTAISRFLEKLREGGLAPATSDKYLSLLKTIFQLGVELDLLTKNPARSIKLLNAPRERAVPFTVPQLKAFVDAALASRDLVGSRMLALLAFTGARLGEAKALRWDDLDLENGTWHLPTQKSGKPGTIVLSSAARAVIAEMAPIRKNDFVFPGAHGNAQRSRPIRLFRKICKAAKLDGLGLKIHSLRHGWVSAAIFAGIPIEIVSHAARHSSPVVTRIYSHPHQSSLIAANEAVAKLIEGST